MRQVFTSTRLENVEGVAKMLGEHGIETKITQGRSWKGNSRREFSYSAKHHDETQQPAFVQQFARQLEVLGLQHPDGGLLAVDGVGRPQRNTRHQDLQGDAQARRRCKAGRRLTCR